MEMADPKYANLPGIAYDQPDMYETSELPEADQNVYVEDQSECVERLHISTSQAHGKFKDKFLESSHVDFSDRISQKRRTGYDAWWGNWEAGLTGEEETLVEKLQRLEREVRELMDEATAVQGEGDEKQSAVMVAKQVEKLHKDLVDLKLESVLGEATAGIVDPSQRKLLSRLEQVKTAEGSKPAASKSSGGAGKNITYELFYRPEQAKLHESSRAATLEKRMERLEQVIGSTPEKLSCLAAETSHRSLLGAVSVLSARSSLLEPAQLDQIEGRLQVLHQRMNQLSEKRDAASDPDKPTKVSELYDMMKKSESLCGALPDIVDRMTALQSLHEQALQFTRALTQLDTVQQQITASLQNNQKLLKDVQSNFTTNIATIQGNMDKLDSRIAALKK